MPGEYADINVRSARCERLLAAIVHVCSEQGYEATTIARVIAHAGISRATFYEYFANKESCFLAALPGIERGVQATVIDSIESQPAQSALAAAITALVAFAQEHPEQARLLMSETMAAGPLELDARDRGIEELAQLVKDAQRRVGAGTPVPTLPSEIVLGATYRLLAARLRRRERLPASLREDLLRWLESYADPAAQRRWRALTARRAPARSPFLASEPLRAPPALAPGRPRTAVATVAENHRLRIIFATAEIIRRDGYAAASVTAITRAAGVDSRAFYQQFSDKRDAFVAVHELGFQSTMAVTAGAFFAAEQWPRRIWEATRTFTQYLEQNPTLTYVSLIAGHVGAPETAQRFERLPAGFTIFLQEGYQHQPLREGEPPSRLALEAIAQTNFEILYRQARSSSPHVAGLVAHLTYICLAPFVGSARAGELIEAMQESAEDAPGGRGSQSPPAPPEMGRER
jgi:AcrR family transcriptional regulator